MKTHSALKSVLSVAITTIVSLSAHAQTFAAKSTDITADGAIAMAHVFNGFGCTGQNLSPTVSWTNPPAGTKSFAIMVHDPDASTGGAGFWHWVVLNIPSNTVGLAQGAGSVDSKTLPTTARQINSDFGTPSWGGPCPPSGNKPHRYNFTVYALKVESLDLPANATASLAGFMINSNTIGKAQFVGKYGR
jgi:Raf kinase inhibitor-like YbhB/YbcL family protein